jgi:hypothetical protein
MVIQFQEKAEELFGSLLHSKGTTKTSPAFPWTHSKHSAAFPWNLLNIRNAPLASPGIYKPFEMLHWLSPGMHKPFEKLPWLSLECTKHEEHEIDRSKREKHTKNMRSIDRSGKKHKKHAIDRSKREKHGNHEIDRSKREQNTNNTRSIDRSGKKHKKHAIDRSKREKIQKPRDRSIEAGKKHKKHNIDRSKREKTQKTRDRSNRENIQKAQVLLLLQVLQLFRSA